METNPSDLKSKIEQAGPLDRLGRTGGDSPLGSAPRMSLEAARGTGGPSATRRTFVESYVNIHPESYAQLRSECLRKYRDAPGVDGISIDQKLQTILFHVMPHFIRRTGSLSRFKLLPLDDNPAVGGGVLSSAASEKLDLLSLERGRLSEEEILDLIGEKIHVPARCYEEARQFVDTDSLRRGLEQLEEAGTTIEPPADGLISAGDLREWVHTALELRIVDGERGRLTQALHERRQFLETHRKRIGSGPECTAPWLQQQTSQWLSQPPSNNEARLGRRSR